MTNNHKVIFGGEGHFYSAYSFTAQELSNRTDIFVSQCSAENFRNQIAEVDVIIPFMQQIDSGMINSAKKLKMIMQFGVGLEGVDINAAITKNVWVCSIPGALCGNAQSCAEHSIYLALSVLRNQKQMQVSLTQGLIGCPTGRTLFGSRILIYGFGGIGQQLAKRLSSFDAEVVAVTRTLPPTGSSLPCQEFVRELGDIAAFPRLASSADVVFICCTQNPSTVGLVDESFISHLKEGAVIVNVARVSYAGNQ
jgi:phosphoglycerate dehydrogenase-like enzyme